MDLDIRQSGNICCLKLKGPLKYGEGVKQLDEAVEGALSSGHIHLLLDLSAMPYVDSSGIGAIVDALRQAKKWAGMPSWSALLLLPRRHSRWWVS